VVLIVVLVMLVVIGLASVYTMRQSINADSIGQNVRSEALAQEAAQIALRHCENLATQQADTIKLFEDDVSGQGHWNTLGNWRGNQPASVPTTLTDDDIANASASFKPTTLPQCMAEFMNLPAGDNGERAVLVTARGFSPDYAADDQGETERGAVVWVQSTLQLLPVAGGGGG
jgi:type IV pilus assembly protein PilX